MRKWDILIPPPRPPPSSQPDAGNYPGFSGQAGRAAADATEASFKTLVKKIYQHSEFEDTQLFRFFREHLPDIRDDIR